MPRIRPAPRSIASRSLAVSGVAPTALAHAAMSSRLGSCLRVSIFDTFDCCRQSISASRAQSLRPAATRSASRASASRPRSRWQAGVVILRPSALKADPLASHKGRIMEHLRSSD